MDQRSLPVYRHRREILSALNNSQVVILESPTGSGKTTQLPVILYEAGYATEHRCIAITQPRRIATLSVSSFIAEQVGPKFIAYKMRFEDTTTPLTKIKILTDGILLQEMRHDPLLSQCSILVIDEAHERTLNIDFLIGLAKDILTKRSDFKLIISSATINTKIFATYFSQAPIVSISATTYPITVVYDPPKQTGEEELLKKILVILNKIIRNKKKTGDVLIFLTGERQIKQCIKMIETSSLKNFVWALPLYGMLIREKQEMVFMSPPKGKTKVIVATNIAETSLTIDGITTVIDSGLCKENNYDPHIYISSLSETLISCASADQRKGRAGRTQSGTCYRLYGREQFLKRSRFTLAEIYRTDLSEVVLRMASLGICDFMGFDFITCPSRSGISGAVETLNLLNALDKYQKITHTGRLMVEFPLLPRHSRILVEAILNSPGALVKCSIIVSFLSTNNPFMMTDENIPANLRQLFSGQYGDFSNYLRLFSLYLSQSDRQGFCIQYHLDFQIMEEIVNIQSQLESISAKHVPMLIDNASLQDVMICCGKGLIQFVCVRVKRGLYRGLTTERIFIHPGSVVMASQDPHFIIAGEIFKTSRMYARSIAPVDEQILKKVSPSVYEKLCSHSVTMKSKDSILKKKKKLHTNSNFLRKGKHSV